MPINIYTVANHLETEGWKLISTSYKNLNTELEIVCPNGHKQIQSYGAWRKHPQCDICMGGNIEKVQKNKVPDKQPDTQRILALDAATIITGYAVYDNGELVSYGTYQVDKDLPTKERIHKIKLWLNDKIKEWEIDFIGLENIQLQSYGRGYQVELYRALANLQGVLIDTAFENCIDSDLVYPTEWRSYCGINEGDSHRDAKKRAAQEKVKIWYGRNCTEDEADAICIGKYFVSILKNNKSSWGEDI